MTVFRGGRSSIGSAVNVKTPHHGEPSQRRIDSRWQLGRQHARGGERSGQSMMKKLSLKMSDTHLEAAIARCEDMLRQPSIRIAAAMAMECNDAGWASQQQECVYSFCCWQYKSILHVYCILYIAFYILHVASCILPKLNQLLSIRVAQIIAC